ncbi:MAG: hypothetical protein AAFQ07_06175, partial [Chloroflexota bacterium]
RRWTLPRGAVSAIFAFNGLLMGLMLILEMDNIGESALFISLFMVAPLLLAGIVADVLIWRLKATPHTPNTNRLIGTVTAFMIGASNLLAIYILGTLQDEFLWWEIHTWLGVPSLCAKNVKIVSKQAFVNTTHHNCPQPEVGSWRTQADWMIPAMTTL